VRFLTRRVLPRSDGTAVVYTSGDTLWRAPVASPAAAQELVDGGAVYPLALSTDGQSALVAQNYNPTTYYPSDLYLARRSHHFSDNTYESTCDIEWVDTSKSAPPTRIVTGAAKQVPPLFVTPDQTAIVYVPQGAADGGAIQCLYTAPVP
jgi:hypothetical protein